MTDPVQAAAEAIALADSPDLLAPNPPEVYTHMARSVVAAVEPLIRERVLAELDSHIETEYRIVRGDSDRAIGDHAPFPTFADAQGIRDMLTVPARIEQRRVVTGPWQAVEEERNGESNG